MNDFDEYLREKAKQEPFAVPPCVKDSMEQALENLPEKKGEIRRFRVLSKIAAAAACFVFVTVFLLPNVSAGYAQALGQIPLLGDIVQVVTIRNYFYSDDNHEMNINVPQISGENSEAADYINKSVSELTSEIISHFYDDLEITGSSGYGSIHVDYDTVMNSERWFTLKLSVSEIYATSNNYCRYYHIDKKNGNYVRLGDLFKTDDFSSVLTQEIKRQMEAEMEKEEDSIYWLDDSAIGEDCITVEADRNFYWDENGDMVIVYDKYEVAPGYMGAPQFTVSKDVIKEILKSDYLDMIA